VHPASPRIEYSLDIHTRQPGVIQNYTSSFETLRGLEISRIGHNPGAPVPALSGILYRRDRFATSRSRTLGTYNPTRWHRDGHSLACWGPSDAYST
jgi:hypothetical protein